jgi:exopolysaccharide/PEP-CTERM locus tyrosine autokinase
MHFDESTGKLDIDNPEFLKDARGIKRLMTYRLINENGTLTPAGRAKYEEMISKTRTKKSIKEAQTTEKLGASGKSQEQNVSSQFENIRKSDRELLMNYNRQTGNILKYDTETGQLDDKSRDILKDPDTVQRLIDDQMILPGGWLTPEAKRLCEKIEEKQTKNQIGASTKHQKQIKNKLTKPSEPKEPLKQSDMEALLQYNPETLKLDLNNPAVLNDPKIVKRLMDNDLIDPNGKLSPKALVRCQVLTSWKQELEKKEITQPKSKGSISDKLQAIAEKDQFQKPSEEADEKKLKIIPLGKDKIEDKAETKIEIKKEEEKVPEKGNNFVTALEARTNLHKPAKAPSKGRFVLGKETIKHVKRKIDKDLVTLMNPLSFEAEQFKIMRTNLLFAESGKTPRSVMVTSAVPGEGKSFVAANLAVSVARHVNWNVLLIDCDLRRPNVHKKFGFINSTGLSDYLANGTDLEPLLLKTGIEKLTILPAGKSPNNPSELLSSERMAELLEEVAARYKDRLVILDSPPPKLTAESAALARYVDGILLVVKYGSTPKNTVIDLIGKLGRDKILGAVMNNFDEGISRYHNRYYGGKYFR